MRASASPRLRRFCRGLFVHVVFSFTGLVPAAAQSMVLGTHVHDIGAGAALPPAEFTSIRLWDARVAWPNLQPEAHRWDFERLDAIVSIATQNRRQLLLPLGLSPNWIAARPDEPSAYRPGNAAPPRTLAAWENYIRTVATRYRGKITHFEIWNEPNKARFYSGTTEEMVRLTCAAYRVIKQVDSAAVVVSPAATTQLDGVRWLEEFLAKGGKKCVDVIGFHFYTLAHQSAEDALPLFKAVRQAMEDNQVGELPLWDTEFGWYLMNKTVPVLTPYKKLDTISATANLAKAYILRASSGIDRAYFYAWNNRYMGLLEPDTGMRKPFANVFKRMAEWIGDSDSVACVEYQGLWQCRMSRFGKPTGEIAWAVSDRALLSIRELVRQVSRSGTVQSANPEGDFTLSIGLPVLMRASK